MAVRAMSADSRGLLFGVYAPTYGMLKDATFRALTTICDQMHCLRSINLSDMMLKLGNGAEIICRSLDDPERARGPNLAGAWLDEASLMKRDAFEIVIASLRGGGGKPGWLSATFTPKGRAHWTYEVFGSGREGTELFRIRTLENPFLPEGFYEAVRSQYTEFFAKQELEGEFIDQAGTLFRREWFRIVDAAPGGLRWARYWDLAASTKTSADYTASAAVAQADDGTVYVRDVIRGRWEWPDQERIMLQTMLLEGTGVEQGIEKSLHGIAAVQTLLRRRELARISVRGIDVDKDKLTRALPVAARAEQGKLTLVRGDWVRDFIDEFVSFTGDGSTHDDQVDAVAGAFAMVSTPQRSRRIVAW